jgi:hypothetical protein
LYVKRIYIGEIKMYKPPSVYVCTICGDSKPRTKFCCGKKECVEAMGDFSKGHGYWMSICRDRKEESGIPVHKVVSKTERSFV